MRAEIIRDGFPSDLLAQMHLDESSLVAEVAARADTVALVIRGQGGEMVGYAVMGFDLSDMVTVYAARSVNNLLARAAMQGIFGAAQILGKPLRVHTEKLRSMARMMGAEKALAAFDGDGLPMGVFDGV